MEGWISHENMEFPIDSGTRVYNRLYGAGTLQRPIKDKFKTGELVRWDEPHKIMEGEKTALRLMDPTILDFQAPAAAPASCTGDGRGG